MKHNYERPKTLALLDNDQQPTGSTRHLESR